MAAVTSGTLYTSTDKKGTPTLGGSYVTFNDSDTHYYDIYTQYRFYWTCTQSTTENKTTINWNIIPVSRSQTTAYNLYRGLYTNTTLKFTYNGKTVNRWPFSSYIVRGYTGNSGGAGNTTWGTSGRYWNYRNGSVNGITYWGYSGSFEIDHDISDSFTVDWQICEGGSAVTQGLKRTYEVPSPDLNTVYVYYNTWKPAKLYVYNGSKWVVVPVAKINDNEYERGIYIKNGDDWSPGKSAD